MSTSTMETATLNSAIDALKGRLKTTWETGDYDKFSRYMENNGEEFFRRLQIPAGTRLLDVGTGSGQLALIAARAGVDATGSDIAANWVKAARERAAAEGLNVKFDEGDAEALPYPDASFDVVASLIGAMFAPRPDLVASELKRVCKPGGKIAMLNWTPSGFVGKMFKAIAAYIAPSGMPAPALWGDEATVRERFREGIATLDLSRHFYRFDYPFGPAEVVEFFRVNYGPMAKAFASLDTAAQTSLRKDLTDLWSSHNQATDGTTKVDAELLQIIAVRA